MLFLPRECPPPGLRTGQGPLQVDRGSGKEGRAGLEPGFKLLGLKPAQNQAPGACGWGVSPYRTGVTSRPLLELSQPHRARTGGDLEAVCCGARQAAGPKSCRPGLEGLCWVRSNLQAGQ